MCWTFHGVSLGVLIRSHSAVCHHFRHCTSSRTRCTALSGVCCGRRQIAGYWAFGYDVGDNILQTVGKPKWLIVMANLMVVRARPFRCNVPGALGRRASCMPGRRETQSSGC